MKDFKQATKSLTARPFWLRYATLAPYRAVCAGTSALTGLTRSGARHPTASVEEAIRHITSVFDLYKASAGVERFHGRIAEIGPGDSCGIGLMFLADGCDEAHLVDRFFTVRDTRHQRSIHRALVERFPQLTSCLRDTDFGETSFAGLTRHYGERAAAETFFDAHRGYDVIVSCAVLEHVYDPLNAVSASASALNHGGMLLYQVDCRDHGQFSEQFHELKFLELPSWLYAPLGWRGGPNRVRLSAYTDALREASLTFTIYIHSLAGLAEELPACTQLQEVPRPLVEASRQYVSRVRDRLASPFREMSDEDLMVTRFMIAARSHHPQWNPLM